MNRRETDLLAELEALKRAVQDRDDFIAVAAHELRNPMTPLLARLERLMRRADRLRGTEADEILADLTELETAAHAFLRRATLLLDVSRVASGNFSVERGRVDLSATVRDVLDEVRTAALYAGSTIEAQLDSLVTGHWDGLAIRQIVENLVSNAIKYGDGKQIHVHVEYFDNDARLTVVDYGIGIPAADQARIFERFERAVPDHALGHHGGFGVGLWLSQRLANALGGDISVTSAPGDGSTFTLTLPLEGTAQRAPSEPSSSCRN